MQRSALCRSRRELSNAYLLANVGFDTAENESLKVCLDLFDFKSWDLRTPPDAKPKDRTSPRMPKEKETPPRGDEWSTGSI